MAFSIMKFQTMSVQGGLSSVSSEDLLKISVFEPDFLTPGTLQRGCSHSFCAWLCYISGDFCSG